MADRQLSPLEQLLRGGFPVLEGAQLAHQFLTQPLRDRDGIQDQPIPVTNILLLHQMSQVGVIADHFKGALKFDCDGLMDAYLRSPMHEIGSGGQLIAAVNCSGTTAKHVRQEG